MLHLTSHSRVIDLLTNTLTQAASEYSSRTFSDIENLRISKLLHAAQQRQQELLSQGILSDILKEEPFQYTEDSMEYKIYLMIWKTRGRNRIVEIETFS